ncbi:MAG: hypothetical protein WBC18_07825 [Ottowia sp.]|uniref:hypothetical protein n=1 Tax=Ottowia sp. TaxID=1898956 RepID=UPI003C73EF91
MPIVSPTPIPDAPPVPVSTQPEATFDALYEAFNGYERDVLVPGFNEQIQVVYQNAQAAESAATDAEASEGAASGSAAAAAASATAADSSATAASGSAVTAAASASTAIDARNDTVAARDVAVPAAAAAVTARNEAEGFRDDARDYATEQLIATSATNLTPGAGNKNLTIQANKAFVLGMYLVATSGGTPADYMAGEVISYDRATGALVLSVDDYSGSTARTDWVLGIGSKGGEGTSPTSGPSSVTLFRVGDLLDSVAFVQDGQNGSIYLTRSGGRLSQVVTTFNGKTRTETFNYTGGVLTSVTAVES